MNTNLFVTGNSFDLLIIDHRKTVYGFTFFYTKGKSKLSNTLCSVIYFYIN